jgi:hypothetical protein
MSAKEKKPRIPLLERQQVSPEDGAIYDALLQQRGVVPNMFKTVAHTPTLAQGIAAFLKPLLGDGALSGSYKELVATRHVDPKLPGAVSFRCLATRTTVLMVVLNCYDDQNECRNA